MISVFDPLFNLSDILYCANMDIGWKKRICSRFTQYCFATVVNRELCYFFFSCNHLLDKFRTLKAHFKNGNKDLSIR